MYASVFTTRDPGASQSTPSEATNAISETAYFIKHYFDEGELAAWFSQLETLHYKERERVLFEAFHRSPLAQRAMPDMFSLHQRRYTVPASIILGFTAMLRH